MMPSFRGNSLPADLKRIRKYIQTVEQEDPDESVDVSIAGLRLGPLGWLRFRRIVDSARRSRLRVTHDRARLSLRFVHYTNLQVSGPATTMLRFVGQMQRAVTPPNPFL